MRIPDTFIYYYTPDIYGSPEAALKALSRPLRCQTGPWYWPEPMPDPPAHMLADIDSALRRAYATMREARG